MTFDDRHWEQVAGGAEPHDQTKPLECPCCGNEPLVRKVYPLAPGSSYVQCLGCGLSTGFYGAREAALAAWNRRQPAPPLPVLDGMHPLVLYFATQADAEACAAVVQSVFQNPVEIRLP